MYHNFMMHIIIDSRDRSIIITGAIHYISMPILANDCENAVEIVGAKAAYILAPIPATYKLFSKRTDILTTYI